MKTENTPFNDFLKFYVLQQEKKDILENYYENQLLILKYEKYISKTLQPKNY